MNRLLVRWTIAGAAVLVLVMAGCSSDADLKAVAFEGVTDAFVIPSVWTAYGPAVDAGLVCASATLVSGSSRLETLDGEELTSLEARDLSDADEAFEYLSTFTIDCVDGSGTIDISEVMVRSDVDERWIVSGGTEDHEGLVGGGPGPAITGATLITYAGEVSNG